MEEQILKLKKEVEEIKNRNLRVEADKAWETSYFRVFSIALIIYIIATVALYFVDTGNYFAKALVPAVGYFLSVQSLPFIKKWWLKKEGKFY